MTKEDIDTLVRRMNMYLGPQYQGFINCYVLSYDPIVLCYDFDSGTNADLFILTRETQESKYKMKIDGQNVFRVIEYR